jgi:hypothetical protein
VALCGVLLAGCVGRQGASQPGAEDALVSVVTDLSPASCRKEIDRSDPNETPYLLCPGVGGYSLIVRRVDSGRESVEVVDPAGRPFRLDYQEFVTRHMCTLGTRAEWRVRQKGGGQAPVALIVRVQAREDAGDPEKVTRSYFAVAKITPDQVCVTRSIPEGAQTETAVREAADSAPQSKCAPPLPPMTEGGTVIR